MASNLDMDVLEQLVFNFVRCRPNIEEDRIVRFLTFGCESTAAEVRQALSNLISQSFISADEDLRYSAVGQPLPEPQCTCWTENGKQVRDALCQLHGF